MCVWFANISWTIYQSGSEQLQFLFDLTPKNYKWIPHTWPESSSVVSDPQNDQKPNLILQFVSPFCLLKIAKMTQKHQLMWDVKAALGRENILLSSSNLWKYRKQKTGNRALKKQTCTGTINPPECWISTYRQRADRLTTRKPFDLLFFVDVTLLLSERQTTHVHNLASTWRFCSLRSYKPRWLLISTFYVNLYPCFSSTLNRF